jgi:uncharacterized protein (TIGR00730 family)
MQEYLSGMTLLAGLSPTPTVAIFGSARAASASPIYAAAQETAQLLAKKGFGIITGGGPGIMEAANRGAHESGAPSLGCPIQLERAEPANRYVDLAIPFTYFAPRKATLLAAACAFVIFPGGFGTLDELFEVLAAMQTRKLARVPLILYGSAFWGGLLDWLRETLEARMIDPADLKLLSLVDSPPEAVSLIAAAHLVAEAEAEAKAEPATEPLSPLRQEQEVES